MLKTDTPSNIMELDIDVLMAIKTRQQLAETETILNYVDDTNCLSEKKPLPAILRARTNYIVMTKILGLNVSPDFLLASLTEAHATLVIAPAGAGKSTLAHVKASLIKATRIPRINRSLDYRFDSKPPKGFAPNKFVKGHRILNLVYNNSNVQDINSRHKEMITKLNSYQVPDFPYMDTDIKASTMHSICKQWVMAYQKDLGLDVKIENLSGGSLTKVMMDAIKFVIKKKDLISVLSGTKYEKSGSADTRQLVYEKELISSKVANSLISFYGLLVEGILLDVCLSEETLPEEVQAIFEEFESFYDLDLPADLIIQIFKKFMSIKRTLKKGLDFSDYLYYAHKLLSNPKTGIEIANGLEYIIADEVQDYTTVMWEVLRLLNSYGVPLFAIGDDDQAIYQFRKITAKYITGFKDIFDHSNVYTLTYNRRCRPAILEEANYFVNQLEDRFEKRTRSVKEGGEVSYIPYSSSEGQVQIIKSIINKSKNPNTLAFASRENFYIDYIGMELEKANIPYRVTGSEGSYLPNSTANHMNIFEMLRFLQNPYDNYYRKDIFMFLPFSKAIWHEIIGYDSTKNKFKNTTPVHFKDLDYSKVIDIKGVKNILNNFYKISNNIETAPMKDYVRYLIELYKSSYLNFYRKSSEGIDIKEEIKDIMEQTTFEWFNSDLTYPKFRELYEKRLVDYRIDVGNRTGCQLSTFHKLKGLEYRETVATFMDGNIFPNYDILRSQDAPEHVIASVRAGDIRLWYVTITRSIDKFTALYSENRPSEFVLERLNPSVIHEYKVSVEDRNNVLDSMNRDLTEDLYYMSMAEDLELSEQVMLSREVVNSNLEIDIDLSEELEYDPVSVVSEQVSVFKSATEDVTSVVSDMVEAIHNMEDSLSIENYETIEYIEESENDDEDYEISINTDDNQEVKDNKNNNEEMSEDDEEPYEMPEVVDKNLPPSFSTGAFASKLLQRLGGGN